MKSFCTFLLSSLCLLSYPTDVSFAQERRAWEQPQKITVDSLNATTAIISLRFDTATLSDTLISPLFGVLITPRPGRAIMSICYQIALDSAFRQTVLQKGETIPDGSLVCLGSNLLFQRDQPLPPPNVHIDSALLLRYPLVSLKPNTQYFCRARAWSMRVGWDYGIDSFYSDTLRFTTPLGTSVQQPLSSDAVSFEQASPNPANETTQCSFALATRSFVHVSVVDAVGKTVMTSEEGWREMGRQSISLDVQSLPQGVYFVRLAIRTAQGEMSSRALPLHIVR